MLKGLSCQLPALVLSMLDSTSTSMQTAGEVGEATMEQPLLAEQTTPMEGVGEPLPEGGEG